MEFLFRPIERLFEGRREDQLRLDQKGGGLRRTLKNLVFLLIAFVLGNLFLAYFVGVDALLGWTRLSPLEHWSPFLVVLTTTGLVFFDFAYFREQMCTVACPYARLQSVLLDKSSLVVGYDPTRGEPRAKGKPRPGVGDCIDCNACVVACPTGIDIRDGLQLECIACAQCADACDGIMQKVHKPIGLIRYSSPANLETREATRIWRPRVVIYSAMLVATLGALIVLGSTKPQAEITVLRGIGAPFVVDGDEVTGAVRVKIRNRSDAEHRYELEVLASPPVKLVAPENPLVIAAGAQRTTTIFTVSPRSSFVAGTRNIQVRVSDGAGFSENVPYRLVGPEKGASP
jgi:cytochrome c oxidase accessory protein FixG